MFERGARRKLVVATTAFATACTMAATALAYSPVGGAFPISHAGGIDANRDADHPAVAYNSTDNEYLVVWVGDEVAGTDNENDVFGELLSATGGEVKSDFRISAVGPAADTTRAAANPAVAYNPTDNEYLVVWEGDDIAANEFEIYGQRLNAAGTGVGDNDFQISNASGVATTRDANNPAVAYNPTATEYLVAWEGDEFTGAMRQDEVDIWGHRVDADGSSIGGDLDVSTIGAANDTTVGASDPSIAYGAIPNEFLVAFDADCVTVQCTPVNPGELETFGHRVNATGTPQGADFRISTQGTDGDSSRDALHPTAAYGATANEYLVAWDGDGLHANDEFEISGHTVDAAGVEQGDDFQVSNAMPATGSRSAVNPSAAYSSAQNEFLVAWEGDGPPSADGQSEISAQELNTGGGEIGAEYQISNVASVGATRDAHSPAIAYNAASNQYLATWRDDTVAPGELEIFGRRLAIVPPTSPASVPTASTSTAAAPAAKKCKKGFKLKTVKGKKRCVRKKRKH